MTIKVIGVTECNVDEKTNTQQTKMTAFTSPTDSQYEVTYNRYGSSHYKVRVVLDSELNAYVAMGGKSDQTYDPVNGIDDRSELALNPALSNGFDYVGFCGPAGSANPAAAAAAAANLPHVVMPALRDNWSSIHGRIPIWMFATTRPQNIPWVDQYSWTTVNKAGGCSTPTTGGGQWLTAGNVWWFHGGNIIGSDPDNPTWYSLNSYDNYKVRSFGANNYSNALVDGGNTSEVSYTAAWWWCTFTENVVSTALLEAVEEPDFASMVATMEGYGFTYIGKVDPIQEGDIVKGYLYVGGVIAWDDTRHDHLEEKPNLIYDVENDTMIGLYYYSSITSQNGIAEGYSYQVEVKGFNEIVQPDYYPWAIRKTDGGVSTWQSCNRTDAYLKIKDGADWRDCKNGGQTDTVHTYDNGDWEVCPKIGENA